MNKPTIYLTNWSSKRRHGPGRKLTIMARPRAWERGEGSVTLLTPVLSMLDGLKSGRISPAAYFASFRGDLEAVSSGTTNHLSPGVLGVETGDPQLGRVADGDSLLCACAVGAPCHRREAAPYLVRAGWRVLLDGVEVTNG